MRDPNLGTAVQLIQYSCRNFAFELSVDKSQEQQHLIEITWGFSRFGGSRASVRDVATGFPFAAKSMAKSDIQSARGYISLSPRGAARSRTGDGLREHALMVNIWYRALWYGRYGRDLWIVGSDKEVGS